MMDLRDDFGRTFKTLRISLINTCNLGCVYCTCGSEDIKENYQLTKEQGLSVNELSGIIKKLHQNLNFETIRFTGGEPLLYPDLIEIVSSVKNLGVTNLKLTTNGLLLDAMAADLAKAGITSMNVSLDAIDESVFYKVSQRRGIQRIFNGIDKAISLGVDVKLNTVIMRNLNEDQILPLLEFAFERGIKIRFLEIMAMGHLFRQADQHFFPQEDILSIIRSKYNFSRQIRKNSSTANYWKTDTGNIFGIVANETEPFCTDCNRLRLDSMGNIYGCLSSNNPISLRNISSQDALQNSLQKAMEQKQAIKFTGSNLSMLTIGG